MSTRRLVLAGGTVAFAALGAVKRNRRSSRPRTRGSGVGVTVAIPLLGGVVFALPNMPDLPAIFLKFWNIGQVIWDQIQHIVLSILSEAWHLLEEALDTALHLIDETFEVVTGAIGRITDEVGHLSRATASMLVQTTDWLTQAFANFRQQLQSMLGTLWTDITDFILEKIPDFIGGLAGDALDFLTALMELGTDGLAFLLDLVDDPIGFLWSLLSGLVNDAISVALEAFELGAGGLESLVEAAIETLMGGITNFFAVMKAIWHILEWIAEHIDDFTIDVLNDIINLSPDRFAEKLIEAMDANRGDIEKKLVGWIT